MKTRVTISILVLLCGVQMGCTGNATGIDPIASKNNATIANAEIVKEAGDLFAAGNEYGSFATDIDQDANSSGQTLLDLLPGGELLVNLFTGERTEPRLAGSAIEPGAIIYERDWYCGFTVTAHGSADVVASLRDEEPIEETITKANCLIVQAAAEAFALENNGVYATDNTDLTPLGNTVQDFLPGGQLLENPASHQIYEPGWAWAAANPGEIGYVGVSRGGVIDGYSINAFGRSCQILRIFCAPGHPRSDCGAGEE